MAYDVARMKDDMFDDNNESFQDLKESQEYPSKSSN